MSYATHVVSKMYLAVCLCFSVVLLSLLASRSILCWPPPSLLLSLRRASALRFPRRCGHLSVILVDRVSWNSIVEVVTAGSLPDLSTCFETICMTIVCLQVCAGVVGRLLSFLLLFRGLLPRPIARQ